MKKLHPLPLKKRKKKSRSPRPLNNDEKKAKILKEINDALNANVRRAFGLDKS